MPIEKITSLFIEKLLKTWQKGDFAAEDLKTLNLCLAKSQSLEQERLSLRDKLYHLVLDKLPTPYLNAIATKNLEQVFLALKEFTRDTPSEEGYLTLVYCRYLDIRKYSIGELASAVGVSPRTLRRYLLKGFEIISLEIKAEISKKLPILRIHSPEDYFPAMDTDQAMGIDSIIAKISTWILADTTSHAISIEGIGGIGKTLIAKHLWQNLHQKKNFDGYTWVSARQKELSLSGEIAPVDNFASTLEDIVARLAHQLGQTHLAGLSSSDKLKGLKKLVEQNRLLIVIDNLETVSDVENLVPELLKLTGPTKLVITSRKSLSKYPQVRTFPVPELSFENSRLLVISEIQRRGISLPLADETIQALYKVTGGIPLALKLATAQFGFRPVKEIIQELRMGEKNAQNMYIYIYRQAWLLLDDTAKELLLAMLLVSPDGDDRQWICDMGGFSFGQFQDGLEQLKRLSLVEFSGTMEAPRYRIHRLTTTFLQSDILQGWER